ncbi:MAG: hypothetical protein SF339_10515, partial [Blastocatellia bacterium]|nr:hypothetical protein [Blastocatellia bacterium]
MDKIFQDSQDPALACDLVHPEKSCSSCSMKGDVKRKTSPDLAVRALFRQPAPRFGFNEHHRWA